MKEFKSFYKTVQGNEGNKCHYSTRLDTYGCGCSHDCKYCYAKSLLSFRNLWNPDDPSVADIKSIERKVKTLKRGGVLRLGGMTDCFQPCEAKYRVTYETIRLLNKYGIHYLIVTKSSMIANEDYVTIMDKDLAHIQVTITSTDDNLAKTYEKASPTSERIMAIEKLSALGFDVSVRISPFIPQFIDFEILNNIKCKKALIEFLRVNAYIKNTFDLDYSLYTHKEGGYYHLPLEIKKNLLKNITGFEQISVCEDCSEAYNYWKTHVNYNPSDCCNLTFGNENKKYLGDLSLLNMKKIGFLSSQKCSSATLAKLKEWVKNLDYDSCVVSGFQSRYEKEVLKILLESKHKIIYVLSTAVFEKCPKKYEDVVEHGNILIISPLDAKSRFATRDGAKARNQFVIDVADEMVIGDLSNGGMLDNMLRGKKFILLGERL